jgi:hypothetical protein
MPEKFKKWLIAQIQAKQIWAQTDIWTQSDKDFICDNIHNYETITDGDRADVLDIIDGLELFSLTPNILNVVKNGEY